MLQAGNVENPWLSAMSSHFAYWASADAALFVLRALHGLDVRQGTPLEGAGASFSGAEGVLSSQAKGGEGVKSPGALSPIPSPKGRSGAAAFH